MIAAAVLGAVAVLLFARLSAFGIWDPWELAAADLARELGSGSAPALERPPLTPWLISLGFSTFGIHEWAGRLPMALSGLLAAGLACWIGTIFAGRRAGVWAAAIAGTSPLFLLNSRQMLGTSPAMATSAAVFGFALAAVFAPAPNDASAKLRERMRIGYGVGLIVSIALATYASGALLGVAPPLLAVAGAILVRRELVPPFAHRPRAIAAALVCGAGVLCALGVAHAIWADYAGFGLWTGGVPRGGNPPTWEMAIEAAFHSLAPWSAILPIALAHLLRGRTPTAASEDQSVAPEAAGAHPEQDALRLAIVLWVAFGFVAQTLFTARYGPAAFLPLVGAALAVALLFNDVERSGRSFWGAAIVAGLFVGLLIRDFKQYPSGPIEGLAVAGIEVPEVFDPAKAWAGVLGAFAVLLGLGLAANPSAERPRLNSAKAVGRYVLPYELVVRQWRRGLSEKFWLGFIALIAAALLAVGVIGLLAPAVISETLGLSTLAVRIGRGLAGVVPGVLALIAIGRLAFLGFAILGPYRLVPALVAGLVVGGYTSLVFQPELSSHFSPREVYDTYNELAADAEPLGEFRVGGRAAAYYATGEVEELRTQGAVLEFLQREDRVWVAFQADDLASIDRDYRRRAERHLFVADARSARMILATNQPIEGRANQNYLAENVLDAPPEIQHPITINFDDRITLLGYNLDLPNGNTVGPGQQFSVTWVYRVVAPITGNYQPFVHIDGPGQRINGDHEPLDGRYPLRLWEPGDIVLDTHTMRVPANYRRGNLTIYMGFYSGEARLEVLEGPKDDVNRARVGTLRIL